MILKCELPEDATFNVRKEVVCALHWSVFEFPGRMLCVCETKEDAIRIKAALETIQEDIALSFHKLPK